MADWDTADYANHVNGHSNHSRQSSQSSGHSGSNKENRTLDRQYSESTTDNSSERELILRGGKELTEESRTEITPSSYDNPALQKYGNLSSPDIPSRQPMTHGSGSGTAKERAQKSPYSGPSIDSIPEDEITIPNNADISGFSCDQLANFLKCLKIDDRIVGHLHRKSVDGKRFSKFKDSELETLGMKNPVVMFFRDKSNNTKTKKKQKFVL